MKMLQKTSTKRRVAMIFLGFLLSYYFLSNWDLFEKFLAKLF